MAKVRPSADFGQVVSDQELARDSAQEVTRGLGQGLLVSRGSRHRPGSYLRPREAAARRRRARPASSISGSVAGSSSTGGFFARVSSRGSSGSAPSATTGSSLAFGDSRRARLARRERRGRVLRRLGRDSAGQGRFARDHLGLAVVLLAGGRAVGGHGDGVRARADVGNPDRAALPGGLALIDDRSRSGS